KGGVRQDTLGKAGRDIEVGRIQPAVNAAARRRLEALDLPAGHRNFAAVVGGAEAHYVENVVGVAGVDRNVAKRKVLVGESAGRQSYFERVGKDVYVAPARSKQQVSDRFHSVEIDAVRR